MMDDKLEYWRSWIGRGETTTDVMDPARARALQATLGDPGAPLTDSDALPPLWQWIYFWHAAPAAELDADGHARRGGFMPPIDLPQRVWAGCRLAIQRPLHLGRPATRHASIADVQAKHGRSGSLVIVTVRHLYGDGDGECIEEYVDLAYRAAASQSEQPASSDGAPRSADWQWRLTPDIVLLFRYSALIFNAHRIHYDRDYAVDIAGYRGLLVHGPLLATLMAELLRRQQPTAKLSGFACRARRPCIVDAPLTIGARSGDGATTLWVADQVDSMAMSGEAALGSAP